MRSTPPRWPLIAALAFLTACASAKQASAPYYGPNDARMSEPAATGGGVVVGMAPQVDAAEEGMPQPEFQSMSEAAPRPMVAAEEVMVTSSSSGDEMRSARREAPSAPPPPPPPPMAPPAQGQPGKKAQPEEPRPDREPGGAEVAAVRQPMLIYTAAITMVVAEIKAALSQVEALSRDLGGYLARRDDLSITIRVPVARFDEAVRRVESLGEVVHRNMTVDDVTEEFVDLEVRLKNLRAIRARLESLLAKAKTVEESVLIERELGRVAGEIDRIEGRMKLLRDRAAYSTITVSMRPKPRESLGPDTPRVPVGWLDQLGLGRLLSL